jgi:enoyl-CoA hydratase/carnithine racemase
MSAAEQFRVDEVSPSYWRVTFDNGPVNLLDPDTVDQLGVLIERIESDPDLTVVVFRSEKPGYFMAHWDFLSDSARVAGMRPGPTGLHPYLDNFIRLSRLPVATIAEIRGRARGAGSEFVLATDIRFASARWPGWGAWSAAAAPWRSCSAAMTSPPPWPPNTVT